jgi:hypothetical protein
MNRFEPIEWTRVVGSGINIIKRGNELIVCKDGKELRAFHEISDDYAHTNAMAYARKLVLESNVDSKGESK